MTKYFLFLFSQAKNFSATPLYTKIGLYRKPALHTHNVVFRQSHLANSRLSIWQIESILKRSSTKIWQQRKDSTSVTHTLFPQPTNFTCYSSHCCCSIVIATSMSDCISHSFHHYNYNLLRQQLQQQKIKNKSNFGYMENNKYFQVKLMGSVKCLAIYDYQNSKIHTTFQFHK